MQNKSLWGNFLNGYYGNKASNKAINNSTQAGGQKRIQSYEDFEKAFYEKHQVEAEEPFIPEEAEEEPFIPEEAEEPVVPVEAEEPFVPEENEYFKNDVDVDKSLKSTLGLDEKSERNLDEVSEDELAEFKLLNGIDDENIVVDKPTETKVKSVKVSKAEKVEKTEKKQQRAKTEKKQVKAEKKQAKAAK